MRADVGRAGRMIPGKLEHIELLKAHIPPEDDEDMRRGWGMSSGEMLYYAFENSEEVWTLLSGPDVVGMWGCGQDGNVWLIRGEGMERIAVKFIRRSREVFERLTARHGTIFCVVSRRYTKLLRWLDWCGFATEPHGAAYVRRYKCAD